jgi:plasmid stabilization system protein ParE
MENAVSFYEEKQPGLGIRFLQKVEDAIVRIRTTPLLYRKIDSEIRKCRILRFPYGLIYRQKNGYIEIIAVMHLKRKPGYWKKRV